MVCCSSGSCCKTRGCDFGNTNQNTGRHHIFRSIAQVTLHQKTVHPLTATCNKKKSEISHQPCPGSPSKIWCFSPFFLSPIAFLCSVALRLGGALGGPKPQKTYHQKPPSGIYVSETKTIAKAHCHDPRPSARYFNRKLSGK